MSELLLTLESELQKRRKTQEGALSLRGSEQKLTIPILMPDVLPANHFESHASVGVSSMDAIPAADEKPDGGNTPSQTEDVIPDWWKSWELGTRNEEELEAVNDFIDNKMGWLFTMNPWIRVPVGLIIAGVGLIASLPGVPGPGVAILGLGVAVTLGSKTLGKGIARFAYKVMDFLPRWAWGSLTFRNYRRPAPRLNSRGQRLDRTRAAFDWGD